jgi:nucleoside diphosphate kinase
MAIERTLSIIKPDATARNLTGAVNALIEEAGLRIIAQKRVAGSGAGEILQCPRRGVSPILSSS